MRIIPPVEHVCRLCVSRYCERERSNLCLEKRLLRRLQLLAMTRTSRFSHRLLPFNWQLRDFVYVTEFPSEDWIFQLDGKNLCRFDGAFDCKSPAEHGVSL